MEVQVRPPMAVTNAVSWRSEGLKYRRNEVFLDVVESINMLANSNGNVVKSEIVGAIKMRVYLSGMPELRLGLNDKVMFENTGRSKLEWSNVFTAWRQYVTLSTRDSSRERQGRGNGRCQVPPVRAPGAFRQ